MKTSSIKCTVVLNDVEDLMQATRNYLARVLGATLETGAVPTYVSFTIDGCHKVMQITEVLTWWGGVSQIGLSCQGEDKTRLDFIIAEPNNDGELQLLQELYTVDSEDPIGGDYYRASIFGLAPRYSEN